MAATGPAVPRLRDDVVMFATTIGERNLWRYQALERAAEYIEAELTAAGYTTVRQRFEISRLPVSNVEAVLTGTTRRDEHIVVGAHYDTVGECPGANDNGTGVAAVLELARRFADRPLARTLRFVAFVNEEPPFFQTEQMGSLVYARAAQARGDRITAMLSLETIGYYSDEEGSQEYPAPFASMFPDVGNFIGVVGNQQSSELVRRIRHAFTANSSFPIQAAALPAGLPGVAWSDHWSFWQTGCPAVMITDTAPFRYPWYHTPHDTPEKISYGNLALVVDGLEHVIADLANR